MPPPSSSAVLWRVLRPCSGRRGLGRPLGARADPVIRMMQRPLAPVAVEVAGSAPAPRAPATAERVVDPRSSRSPRGRWLAARRRLPKGSRGRSEIAPRLAQQSDAARIAVTASVRDAARRESRSSSSRSSPSVSIESAEPAALERPRRGCGREAPDGLAAHAPGHDDIASSAASSTSPPTAIAARSSSTPPTGSTIGHRPRRLRPHRRGRVRTTRPERGPPRRRSATPRAPGTPRPAHLRGETA